MGFSHWAPCGVLQGYTLQKWPRTIRTIMSVAVGTLCLQDSLSAAGGGAGGCVGVHWGRAPPGLWRSCFNGLAQAAHVSENVSLYLLPLLVGYFSRAELAPSLITSHCCTGKLHPRSRARGSSPAPGQRSKPKLFSEYFLIQCDLFIMESWKSLSPLVLTRQKV